MKTHRVTIMPGDGIGPEVMAATIKVLKATGVLFAFDHQPIGGGTLDGLPQAALDSIKRTRVGLKGPTATPVGGGARSLNVRLRETFDLFANVRPIRTMAGIKTRFSDVPIDILIFRENLEDLYAGDEEVLREMVSNVRTVISKAHFTEAECYRMARFAFATASEYGRKRMTVVHKANIIKEGHGMFLSIAQEVARSYPKITCDNLIADNCMMQLVQNPERFDCILAPNLFGDLLSDLCAGLIGGLGFAPGANIGSDVAIFEAVHGTAPDIAGKGVANPTSLILSAAMMLDHLEEHEAANRVRAAVNAVLLEGVHVTADAKRAAHVGTDEYVDAVIKALRVTEPA